MKKIVRQNPATIDELKGYTSLSYNELPQDVLEAVDNILRPHNLEVVLMQVGNSDIVFKIQTNDRKVTEKKKPGPKKKDASITD